MTPFPFIIEPLGDKFVLRDDKIIGGTKRRALNILLSQTPQNRIFYAGTTMGHGALALAHACQDAGKTAEIFISCTDETNPMLAALKNTNSTLHVKAPLPIATLHALAGQQSKQDMDAAIFPPGFALPEFTVALGQSIAQLDMSPYSEIWATSVTGTLANAIQTAFPDKPVITVSVVKSNTRANHTAPEKYHQPAKSPPPYPSCAYTDSKLWQFAQIHAASGALIWNTAG